MQNDQNETGDAVAKQCQYRFTTNNHEQRYKTI